MSELKKCPFCGGDATIQKLSNSTLSFVVCVDCRMRTPTLQDGKTAMRVWNTRTPMDNILENIVSSLESEKIVFLGTRTEHTGTIFIDDAINIVKQEINNGLE